MRGRTLLLVSAIALSLLAWMLLGNRRTPVAARPASAPAAVPAADAEARARAEEAYASQTGARIEELAKMEAEQKKRARAAAESVQARTAVQRRHDKAWSIVVTTNWQRYQALREKMEQSHAHSAHCTICYGNGLMPFCVLCEGTGKCPACRGTGQ